jgi:hypothetical protein
MRNVFDQLAKKLGLRALGTSGLTVAHDEISPDAHYADLRHEPNPNREAERARLGLLGRMASVVCLIEVFSTTPSEDEVLACLGKLIAFRQKRRRETSKQRKRAVASQSLVRPFGWIVCAGRPTTTLQALGAEPASGWPRGVYFSPGASHGAHALEPKNEDVGGLCRLGIVVASELPRDRSTLLVRVMAGGLLLPEALQDLDALPRAARERALASSALLRWQRSLRGNQVDKEEDLAVTQKELIKTIDEWLESYFSDVRNPAHQKGFKIGHREGQLEALRETLRRVLDLRGLVASRAEKAKIQRCTSLEALQSWHDRALTARSVAEVFEARPGGTTTARRAKAAKPS